jgi:hypothetical protein
VWSYAIIFQLGMVVTHNLLSSSKVGMGRFESGIWSMIDRKTILQYVSYASSEDRE